MPVCGRTPLAALFAVLLTGGSALAEPITVSAEPIGYFSRDSPDQTRFGDLIFRGGLVLESGASAFGGLSGLRMHADGARFHAVSDRAHWLTGRIVYEGTRPVGLDGADLAPIRGGDGGPLDGTPDDDTEGLEIHGSIAWISTERSNNILRFDLDAGASSARGVPTPMPDEVSGLPRNGGLEALARIPEGGPEAGRLIAISEEAFGGEDHAAWLIDPEGQSPAGRLVVRGRDGFAVTDAVLLPDGGDLVLMERRFRWPRSLHVRVRRVPRGEILAGAVLDGRVLMEASLSEEIDNLEAISAHRAADGATVLTLLSDDNFSPLQRTVLLQFTLAE